MRIALDRAARAAPAGVTLLRACAFLGPGAVPLWLFDGGTDELPEPLPAGPAARAAAVGSLAGLALVSRAPDCCITVDPSVAAAARDSLGDGRRGSWAAGAVRLLAAAFPEGDDATARARRRLLVPHAVAVTSHEEAITWEPQASSRLLERVAVHVDAEEQPVVALRLLERAVTIAEGAYGGTDPETGARLSTLGVLLAETGAPTRARACLQRALAVAEATFGPEHPTVGGLLHDLGRVLHELGEPAAARLCLERAVAVDRAAYGAAHPVVGEDLADLGLVLADLGELPAARLALERALAVAEATGGARGPAAGRHLADLAVVLQDMGEAAAARVCLVRALDIAGATYGPRHPAVAALLNNLGGLLADIGRLEEALGCFDRALAIDEPALGGTHSTVRGIRENRAQVLRRLRAAV